MRKHLHVEVDILDRLNLDDSWIWSHFSRREFDNCIVEE